VFNALDNVDARRYVNRMCLAVDVPLIETGTAGLSGQAQAIIKGRSECYDCKDKPTRKTYPVCTIRNTPSQPIHCIVWAKSYLFAEIFGAGEDDPVVDDTKDADNSEEIEKLLQEARALKSIRESIQTPEFAQLIFDKVFKTDVLRLRDAADIWKGKTPPAPLDFDSLAKASVSESGTALLDRDQITWSLEQSFAVFLESTYRLAARILDMNRTGEMEQAPSIQFDKDDDDTLNFVVAASNIRSHIFGIPTLSKFEIKEMAGNIIPAVATTNALIAGLSVLLAFRCLPWT